MLNRRLDVMALVFQIYIRWGRRIHVAHNGRRTLENNPDGKHDINQAHPRNNDIGSDRHCKDTIFESVGGKGAD